MSQENHNVVPIGFGCLGGEQDFFVDITLPENQNFNNWSDKTRKFVDMMARRGFNVIPLGQAETLGCVEIQSDDEEEEEVEIY
jgi:hypothetical protein